MDFKINREIVSAAECIYEGVQEQSVELDYILPDYFPDIFRLVRCEVQPVITEYSVNGDKLNYELKCDIKILYCSESSSVIQCVSQQKKFSRTAELGQICEKPMVKISAKADHFNYRAVNKRRLEARGAVSIRIKVRGEKSQEIVSDAFGLNVQVRKTPVSFAAKKLSAEKIIQLNENTELSETQPPVVNIVSCRCKPSECEKKIISGKLLAKGDVNVKLLYSCEKDGEGALEPLDFSVPYSQIVDMDGIDESFDCRITAEAVTCDVSVSGDKNGDNNIIKCEIELKIICNAVKTASVTLATDAFSTVHPCQTETADVSTELNPTIYDRSFRSTAKLSEGDSVPQLVYSIWCEPKNINTRLSEDGKSVIISGMLTYTMAAKDSSGMIVMPEKDCAFEETAELDDIPENSVINAEINASDVSYNISSDNVLTAKAELSARISVSASASIKALTDIVIDDSVKKERDGDYAIKLYYGVENEEVWSIAKRYSTSVTAVMEENEIAGERLENGGMLLIPIVN